jgi:adenosylcobinamide kinase / adenosylcobinamide-phosphate guanylyltransferase
MIPPLPVFDCRIALVIGGARSGKSRYAQALAEASARELVFVATAEALDDEMGDRIRRHREDRGDLWRTREEPLELAKALAEETAPGRVALVDCLTLWLSNLMHAGRSPEREIESLVAVLRGLAGPAILVSNEVGLGVAPMTPLGRAFRDWQGRLNSEVAAAADAVVAMTAGLPRLAKPAPAPYLRFV